MKCQDIVKHMNLNYRCVESQKARNQIKNMFLVEKNFQYYFLKVRFDMNLYELALEKSLKKQKLIVPILYHKIIDKRFVGIYSFQPNLGTLEDLVVNNQLSLFDKYSYMRSITYITLLAMKDRNPIASVMTLNLIPNNILVLKNQPHGLRFINATPIDKSEEYYFEHNTYYEKNSNKDARTLNILFLGRIFHFICFGKEVATDLEDWDIIKELDKFFKFENEQKIDQKIVYLIRIMLNENPIDRPSFEIVFEVLQDVLDSFDFFFERKKDQLNYLYLGMRNEVAVENLNNTLKETDHERKNHNEFGIYSDKDIHIQIAKKLPGHKYLTNINILNKMIKSRIRKMIRLIQSSEINADSSESDKLNMINDMYPSDFEKNSLVRPNYRKIAKGSISEYYENDLEDLKLIAIELFNPLFLSKSLRRSYIFEIKNQYLFAEKSDFKIYDEKISLLECFFTFLKLEIKRKDQNSFIMEESYEDYLFPEENPNYKQDPKKISLWEKLLLIPVGYLIVMLLCQLLMFVFSLMYFLKNSNVGKYNKNDFKIFISF